MLKIVLSSAVVFLSSSAQASEKMCGVIVISPWAGAILVGDQNVVLSERFDTMFRLVDRSGAPLSGLKNADPVCVVGKVTGRDEYFGIFKVLDISANPQDDSLPTDAANELP